jgi:hypothetical protein
VGGGSKVTSNGDFGIDGKVFYALPTKGSYGNEIGSVNGKLFVAPNNISDIKFNLLNFGCQGCTFSQIPQNGNYFLNGFQSNQPGNLQGIVLSMVARPIDLPELPKDPCGSGSTLVVKNSAGVIPFASDLSSFSIFPEVKLDKHVQNSFDITGITLASNASKVGSCNKG